LYNFSDSLTFTAGFLFIPKFTQISIKMVLCHHANSFLDSIKNDARENSCQEDVNPCECVKIIGRDHLKSKRARKFRCNKRIRRLAQPKTYTRKYCEDETKSGKAAVEIIRTFEEQTPVRIKLLAYPKVRRLVSSRDAYKGMIDREWYERFEGLIRRSMLTMYSRLANVQLPDQSCRKKWTKEDWKRHCEWLKKRALPKMQIHQPAMIRKKVPISALVASMFVLSRPRKPRNKFHPYCGYQSPVKDSALSYEPSDRILKLAAPKHPKDEDDDEEVFEPFQVNPRALKFQPSSFSLFILYSLKTILNRLQANV
jgi:Testicular haploid expressed repeat